MKYLNLIIVAIFITSMISCNGNAKKSTHIEDSESMEIEDENIDDDEDESEYLESAMDALENGDNDLAVAKIMQAIESIKGYVGEMDDPVHANDAITALTSIATKIKSGNKISPDALKEALLKLEFFSDDDLEIDDDDDADDDDVD